MNKTNPSLFIPLLPPSDNHIASLLNNGDQRAIELIYDKFGDALFGVLVRICREEDLARDVLQEALVNVWKYGKRYDSDKGRLFTWLLNIARNKALDRVRQKNRRPEIQVGEEGVGIYETGSTSVNTDTLDLREKVGKLEPDIRVLIDMAYFGGYTQDEISQELDIPLGTVKTRMRRALKELRVIFKA